MEHTRTFKLMSDADLTAAVERLAKQERCATVSLLACLDEFDHRRLYLGLGYPSIYAYCRDELHLADGAAYRRIEVARASRRFPVLLEMLADGRLSLATACLIGQKLEAETASDLLAQAQHKSKREVEALLAAWHPQPPVPSVVRKLPERKEPGIPTATIAGETEPPLDLSSLRAPATPQPPSRRPVVAPLSEAHYKLQVTISTKAHDRLRQIQDLMRHRVPNGDPAAIVEHALEVLHAELLKRKAAEVIRPRTARPNADPKGRHIPASVKRAVFRRDGGRCAFVSGDGRTCGSASGLEFHHVQPYAVGGQATAGNIELRCRAHNGFEWTRHLDQESEALAAR